MRNRIKLNPKTKLLWAKLITFLFVHKTVRSFIDPSVSIDKKTFIGKNVSINKNCIIGANCKIGNNTVLMQNVVLGRNVHIGNDCIIYPNSRLNHNHSDSDSYKEIVIGNQVEIGANCDISSAKEGALHIGEYTKINNLCCIKGNISIGKNVIITGNVKIETNTIINDYVYLAPKVVVKSNSVISTNSQIGMMAVVEGVIPPNEIWVGNPIKFLKKRS